jgi:predicted Fe-S protein YdhL (DUF1289 family)
MARAAVSSPCIGVCRMDTATGWCEGCLRTIDEIVAWGAASEAQRSAVMAQLPARRVRWRAQRAGVAGPPAAGAPVASANPADPAAR